MRLVIRDWRLRISDPHFTTMVSIAFVLYDSLNLLHECWYFVREHVPHNVVIRTEVSEYLSRLKTSLTKKAQDIADSLV